MILRIKYWLPAIAYMAFIFWMSSRPAPEYLDNIPIIFKLKIVHIIEYGILFMLYHNALKRTTKYNDNEIFAVSFMMALIFGLTDEFHQIFVVGRTARFEDVAANSVGVIVAQLIEKFRPV